MQKAISVTNQTKEKVEAAKSYIEQRYSKLIGQERDKREYWEQLNQKMRQLNMSSTEQEQVKRKIMHKEAEKLRYDRRKLNIHDFEPVKIIGKGAFGEVRLCRWLSDGEPVAVKKLKKTEMIYKNKIVQVREERNVLANSGENPWIVGLKCSFQDTDSLYLIMDYVPGGDLMNLLIKKDIFTHEEARFYIAEMILAIDSVHKLKYIHRDIKPDNILIDDRGHIKLSDFGLCKHTELRPKKLSEAAAKRREPPREQPAETSVQELKHRRRLLAFSAVGTPDYVAPEVQGKNGYTETVDWWSLGVIFFEMLVGYPPFASDESSITWQKIQNWRKYLVIPKDAHVSPEAVDLIRKLINDPAERLGINGAQEIMAHPFFLGVNWQNIREKKAPNIPELADPFDASNFDPFEEEEPWYPSPQRRSKKGPEFIGYTYKPEVELNSELLKALVDLDSYRQPAELHRNSLETLYLEETKLKKELETNFTSQATTQSFQHAPGREPRSFLKREKAEEAKKEYYAAGAASPKYPPKKLEEPHFSPTRLRTAEHAHEPPAKYSAYHGPSSAGSHVLQGLNSGGGTSTGGTSAGGFEVSKAPLASGGRQISSGGQSKQYSAYQALHNLHSTQYPSQNNTQMHSKMPSPQPASRGKLDRKQTSPGIKDLDEKKAKVKLFQKKPNDYSIRKAI